ncbi:hypothetical protein AFB00_27915 [Pseudonocardia sp. HH130630-07]|nr:hypothetical protein AFB00_27915 [Pseudonocardia sp. HH130630-07]
MHEQLAARLRDLATRLGPGGRMPPELELSTEYSVSRTTVRRAVATLVAEGLLIRRQGSGTFVTEGRVSHPLDSLRPVVSMFAGAGRYPEGRIQRFEWTEHGPALAALKSASGLAIRRVYLIDDVPQGLVDITLPREIGARITREQIEEKPIYQILERDLGLTLGHGDMTFASISASPDAAEVLNVPVGDPLLSLSRLTYDDDGRIIEHASYSLIAGLFELQLTVQASGLEGIDYSFSRPGPKIVMRSTSGGAAPA